MFLTREISSLRLQTISSSSFRNLFICSWGLLHTKFVLVDRTGRVNLTWSFCARLTNTMFHVRKTHLLPWPWPKAQHSFLKSLHDNKTKYYEAEEMYLQHFGGFLPDKVGKGRVEKVRSSQFKAQSTSEVCSRRWTLYMEFDLSI